MTLKTRNTEYAVGTLNAPHMPYLADVSLQKRGGDTVATGTGYRRVGLSDGSPMETSAIQSIGFESGPPLDLKAAKGYKIGLSYRMSSSFAVQAAPIQSPDPVVRNAGSAFKKAFGLRGM
jgi:hypothetical protein